MRCGCILLLYHHRSYFVDNNNFIYPALDFNTGIVSFLSNVGSSPERDYATSVSAGYIGDGDEYVLAVVGATEGKAIGSLTGSSGM